MSTFYASYPVGGALTVGSPANGLDITAGVLTIALASTSQTGALSSASFTLFNNKQDALGFTPENVANKGIANGYAPLDSGNKVPVAYLPNSIMEYLGTWSAATNTPTLADGTGNAGDVYVNTTVGTVNFGSGPIVFAIGDWVVYDGSVWQKSVNSNAVASVNGLTGAVVLTTTNISEGTNLYFTNSRAQSAAVANTITSGVTTIAPSQDAVFNALALKANLSGATFTGAISATNLSGTNTGDQNLAPYALLAGATFTGAISATNLSGTNTGDQTNVTGTASNITATSNTTLTSLPNLVITESQVTNLVSDLAGKQPTGNYITDLTGDATASGPGSAALTLATVNANVGSFGTASNVSSFTVNAKGLITAASNTAIQITEAQVTNLVSDLALKAPLASPALTGTPTAPTATAGTNTTQIATTAFVTSAVGAGTFANQTLSNLTSPTAINQDLVPTSAFSSSLGSPTNPWNGIYGAAVGAGVFTTGGVFSRMTALSNPSTINTDLPATASAVYTSLNGNLILTPSTETGVFRKTIIATAGEQTAGDVTANIELTTGPTTLNTNRGEVSIKAKQLNMNSKNIINVLDPVSAQDAATKAYVDNGKVVARYTSSSGQVIATNTETIIDFSTVSYDPNSLVTTGSGWKFTAAHSGYYEVTGAFMFDVAAWTISTGIDSRITKNNTTLMAITSYYVFLATVGAGFIQQFRGSATMFLNAGDFINLRITQTQGANRALLNSNFFNYIEIKQVA